MLLVGSRRGHKMDWFGTITGILGAIFIAIDVRISTIIWLSSNIAYLIWSANTETWSIFTLQAVYLVINIGALIVRCKRVTK